MSFVDFRLPDDISYRASGGPEYSTAVVVTSGGYEQRNGYWTNARRRWEIAYVRTQAQAEALMAHFHEACPGTPLSRLTAEDSFIATGPAYAATMPSAAQIVAAAQEMMQ